MLLLFLFQSSAVVVSKWKINIHFDILVYIDATCYISDKCDNLRIVVERLLVWLIALTLEDDVYLLFSAYPRSIYKQRTADIQISLPSLSEFFTSLM